MTTYIAFLRAINLGPTRKFPKDDIVAATEGAGFTGVATHINTGNVRLDTRMRSRARIEGALEAAYEADRGFAVPAIAFTTDELRAVVEDADTLDHPGLHYVSLLKRPPTEEGRQLIEGAGTRGERAVVRDRAVHLLLGENYHQASIENSAVEKALGVATNRNLRVIRAIAEKWC